MSELKQNPEALQELWPGLAKVTTEDRYVSIVPASTSTKSHNDLRRTFRSYTDPQRKYTYGIPVKFDKAKGLYVFNKIVVDGSQIYNLRNLSEAREFAIVANSPLVVGSPNPAFHIPAVFKIHDEEKQAKQNVSIFSKILSYGIKIEKMSKQDISDLALVVVGTSAINNSIEVNQNLLYTELQKNPARVISAIDNRSKSETQAIFYRSLATRTIVFNKETGYTTEYGSFLGYDVQAAITRLDQQPEVLRTVDFESKKRQGVSGSTKDHAPAFIATQESNIEEAIRRSHNEDQGVDLMGMNSTQDQGSDIDYQLSMNSNNDNAPMQDVAVPEKTIDESNMGRESSARVDDDLVSSLLASPSPSANTIFDEEVKAPKPKVKSK